MLTFPVTLFSGAATLTFLQAETPQGSATTSVTFSSVNLGTASADRYIVVVAGVAVNTAGRTLTSVTIGGNAMTIHANATTSVALSDTNISAICGLLVTAGTSANVVVTCSGTMSQWYCRTYAMTGLASTTPTATKTTSATSAVSSIADSINIPGNGLFIFGVQGDTSNAATYNAVTGAVLNSAQNFGTMPSASASQSGLSAETPRSYSATLAAGTGHMAMAAAVWN